MVLQDRCPADLFAALLASNESVSVATLTRTHPVASGLVFDRRQQKVCGSIPPMATKDLPISRLSARRK